MKFKFPDVGEGIHEGKIVRWHVKEGQEVKEDQVLAEVETDKAVVEIPSPKKGKIVKLHANEGEEIKVGAVMVTFDGPDEEEKIKDSTGAPDEKESSENAKKAGGVVGFIEDKEEGLPIRRRAERKQENNEVMVAPAIRFYAKQKGVDLSSVEGTGPGGRIIKDDIDNYTADKHSSSMETKKSGQVKVQRKYDLWGFIDRVPMAGIRRAVADSTKKSWDNLVHVTVMGEAVVDDLVKHREKEKKQAEENGVKLTYIPFIIKALVSSLQDFPNLNSEIQEGELIVKKYYNIAIAIDTGEGLYTPIIKRAEGKTVLEIAKEVQELAEKAKARKLDPMDMKGGSFTITNLGVEGVKFFTPIINYPQAGILGIGRMYRKPIVKGEKVVVANVLPISLVFDHRAVDGLYASKFLESLIKNLEDIDKVLRG